MNNKEKKFFKDLIIKVFKVLFLIIGMFPFYIVLFTILFLFSIPFWLFTKNGYWKCFFAVPYTKKISYWGNDYFIDLFPNYGDEPTYY
jgi:hypothetical protein